MGWSRDMKAIILLSWGGQFRLKGDYSGFCACAGFVYILVLIIYVDYNMKYRPYAYIVLMMTTV